MTKLIRINQGRAVPWPFRLAGTAIIFTLILAAFESFDEIYAIFTGIILSFGLPPIWSTYYLLEIDPQKKIVYQSVWIVGYKKRQAISYQKANYLFINKTLYSQQMTSNAGNVHTSRNTVYKAFLKLDDEKNVELVSDSNSQRLKKKIQFIAQKLDCDIHENY